MHELIQTLETQLEQHGILALDKVQSRHLIQWLHTLILALQQQDALIKRLKEVCKLDEEIIAAHASRVHPTVEPDGNGEGERPR